VFKDRQRSVFCGPNDITVSNVGVNKVLYRYILGIKVYYVFYI